MTEANRRIAEQFTMPSIAAASTAKPATSLTAAEITAEKSAAPAYRHMQPTRSSFEGQHIHVYRLANSTIADHLADRGDVR